MRKTKWNAYTLTFIGVMAALVYVVTLFRFPLLGSKVHLANAVCVVSGMLLGPAAGGVAAGLGSALYDALAGGYDLVNVLITFVSKFAMAWVSGAVLQALEKNQRVRPAFLRTAAASVLGSLSYVALYMLKTFIFQRYVYGYPLDTTWATLVSKLIPSLINALAAMVAAPVFFHAVLPALRASGLSGKLQASAPKA